MPKPNLAAIGSKAFCLIVFLVSFISAIPPRYMKDLPMFPSLSGTLSGYPMRTREKRFDDVKILLKNEHIIGYTDEAFGPIDYRDGKRFEPYYLAQYALAPLILEADITSYRYVLGNFKEDFFYQNIAGKTGLRVVQNFGNGVVLFEKISK